MSVDVESLYRRYGGLVFRRCRTLLGNDELASDVMHDVFVQVLRREHDLHLQAPSALLFRIATHESLNRIRTRRRRPEQAEDALLEHIAALENPEARSLARVTLDRIFGHEPDSTRLIAVFHLLDGMTLEEVAPEVGMSVSGVRKRLRTLRSKLDQTMTIEE